MNDLQKTELELLKMFLDICDKLGLEYYLVCGTALGAVKYGGFIPWDDDVDVALKREDYELFLREAPKLLPERYFLQNIRTEKAFPLLMTKLRDSGTTLIESNFAHLPMNHGAYIDIFPLDGYPKGKWKQRFFEAKKYVYNKARCFAYIYGYRVFGLNAIMRAYERMLKRYPCEGSDYYCNHGNWQRKLEYSPPEHYGNGAWAEFEGLTVRVPERYDEYFTQKYGDWRSDPPVRKRISHHNIAVCDTEKPYTEYRKVK